MDRLLDPTEPNDVPAPETLGFPSDWPRVAVDIWDKKYRLKLPDGTPVDLTWTDTVRRVAEAAAKAEKSKLRSKWAKSFANAISDFEFLPAGRILAGAGTGRRVTLFNCFVMGRIEDDLTSIFDNVKEAALTMQQGGGIGHDFSTLRPKGALVRSIGADASGPVTFMDVWDAMCKTIMSAGSRRGAMMATLRCDHPDIEEFIDAKREPGRLRNFNLSVLVTDAFIRAVRDDTRWDLRFDGRLYRTVQARELWDKIMRATYEVAEPGVIFIDRIAEQNNLAYCEEIRATNPCGEQPLPAYGACLLGSINLARLVRNPFTSNAELDEIRLQELTCTAIRFLDNIVDISKYPLPAQKQEANNKRRLGLGITGLADALIQLGVRYGSPEAILLTDRWLTLLKTSAYTASSNLAEEKGAFPLCDVEELLARPNLSQLPEPTRKKIAKSGLRNGLLTSIAPTGTISLLAGNVSSGIEPVFDFSYDRRILQRDGTARLERVEDYAHALYSRAMSRNQQGRPSARDSAFVTTAALSPRDHLEMQAAAQKHIDSSISKTINCPQDIGFGAFKDVYLEAYDLGLKGVTTYRPNAVTGSVLSATAPQAQPASSAATGSLAMDTTGEIVDTSEPMPREPILAGYTYKLKWPGSDHAMYITINDTEIEGQRRPFEIFINSKNLEHYAWTLALTRMISAIFRRGGDVSFVVEELRAVFDPQGGRWMNGHYVPSLLAAIGEVIETHLQRIGVLARLTEHSGQLMRVKTTASASPINAIPSARTTPQAGNPHQVDRHCPRCGAGGYIRQDGCWLCRTCGHSNCA